MLSRSKRRAFEIRSGFFAHCANTFEQRSVGDGKRVSVCVCVFCLQEENDEDDLNDPYCVEDNPQRITFEDVTSAAFKIKCGIINTPCVVLRFISLASSP